ncbi:hypothetical protein Hdeb2414_s0013g00414031 [Helianthus debilis subsp. tardiflorus]
MEFILSKQNPTTTCSPLSLSTQPDSISGVMMVRQHPHTRKSDTVHGGGGVWQRQKGRNDGERESRCRFAGDRR